MTEVINKSNSSQDENLSQVKNPSEKEDNRFPYEAPKLYNHGKINDVTLTVPAPIPVTDGLGPFNDIS